MPKQIAVSKTDTELLHRASEIVQWGVDVRPTVSRQQLAEAKAVRAAIARAIAELSWTPVSKGLPDDEITVLICLKDADEPVWLGWHDASGWYGVDATPLRDCVIGWRPMPRGMDG